MMWNLRNEKFMENSRRWLTLAQIAVSTGTSGNSEIPNYEHLALVTGGQNYFGNAGIAPTQPGNEELSWGEALDDQRGPASGRSGTGSIWTSNSTTRRRPTC